MGGDNQRCSKSNSNNQEAFRKNTDNNSNKNKSFNEEEFSIEDLDMKKKLGEGGFGTVYLCEYKKTKQLIAVKIFNIQGITNERKKMIEKESKLLSLIAHKNIIKYYFHKIENNKFYLGMEYCKNLDLQNYIKNKIDKKEKIQEDFIWKICISNIGCIKLFTYYKKNGTS